MIHQSAEHVVFTWGRFKGHSLAHVARSVPSYLEWMSGQERLPEHWRIAAAKTLLGEDVGELDLPRTSNPTFSINNIPQPSKDKVEVILVDKKTAAIIMPYDKQLLARFKYEIDGRKWNNDEKHWEFPIVHLPKVFTVFSNIKCTQAVLDIVDELKNRRQDLDNIRSLEDDADFKIPGLKLPLYNYQTIGVKFVDRAGGRCLIADAPGLGKTVQAIGYAQLHNLKTIVVCPLSVVINWQREIKKFTGKESTIWDSKGYDGYLGGEVVGKITNWKNIKDFL
jgi:SNF2-related domain